MPEPAATPHKKSGTVAKPAVRMDMADYPVREYIAALTAELAVLARKEGDAGLAAALDAASALAQRPY